MHVGALGFPRTGPGTLSDAFNLLDHLVDLGVNAVELLPIAEFSGNFSWGYGDTHHFAVEASLGGRDEYKHFVRQCHRHGIAVIQDVVYNHFDNNANRAEWEYDSKLPEQNCYYWYEGTSTDYPQKEGGYLNNGSSGYTPNYRQERVRGGLLHRRKTSSGMLERMRRICRVRPVLPPRSAFAGFRWVCCVG